MMHVKHFNVEEASNERELWNVANEVLNPKKEIYFGVHNYIFIVHMFISFRNSPRNYTGW